MSTISGTTELNSFCDINGNRNQLEIELPNHIGRLRQSIVLECAQIWDGDAGKAGFPSRDSRPGKTQKRWIVDIKDEFTNQLKRGQRLFSLSSFLKN